MYTFNLVHAKLQLQKYGKLVEIHNQRFLDVMIWIKGRVLLDSIRLLINEGLCCDLQAEFFFFFSDFIKEYRVSKLKCFPVIHK